MFTAGCLGLYHPCTTESVFLRLSKTWVRWAGNLVDQVIEFERQWTNRHRTDRLEDNSGVGTELPAAYYVRQTHAITANRGRHQSGKDIDSSNGSREDTPNGAAVQGERTYERFTSVC